MTVKITDDEISHAALGVNAGEHAGERSGRDVDIPRDIIQLIEDVYDTCWLNDRAGAPCPHDAMISWYGAHRGHPGDIQPGLVLL